MGTYYFDLGIIHQAVYNTSRGRFLELTDPYGTNQTNRLSIHFDPIIALFSPFYLLFPKAEVLIVGEIVLVLSAIIPFYLLIRVHLKKYPSLFPFVFLTLSFCFLNYYPLANLLTKNFHAVSLTIPLFFWAFYFFETNQEKRGLVFLFISLFCKETIAITVLVFLGIYHLKLRKKPSFFVFLVVFLSTLIIFSYLFSKKENRFVSYYEKNPKKALAMFFSQKNVNYLWRLTQPLGFLSFFHPYFLASLPEIGLNVLSKNTNMTSLAYHYEAVIIPFLFFSLILTLKKIASFNKKLTIVIMIFLIFNNLLFFKKNRIYFFKSFVNEKKLAIVKEWQKKLTDDQIKVSTSGHLAPYFSGRRYFYNFLFDFAYENFQLTPEDIKNQVDFYQRADYVIVQEGELENPHPLVNFYKTHLFKNKNFKLIFEKEGILVFKKI